MDTRNTRSTSITVMIHGHTWESFNHPTFSFRSYFKCQRSVSVVVFPVQTTGITEDFHVGSTSPKWTLGALAVGTDRWDLRTHISMDRDKFCVKFK